LVGPPHVASASWPGARSGTSLFLAGDAPGLPDRRGLVGWALSDRSGRVPRAGSQVVLCVAGPAGRSSRPARGRGGGGAARGGGRPTSGGGGPRSTGRAWHTPPTRTRRRVRSRRGAGRG